MALGGKVGVFAMRQPKATTLRSETLRDGAALAGGRRNGAGGVSVLGGGPFAEGNFVAWADVCMI